MLAQRHRGAEKSEKLSPQRTQRDAEEKLSLNMDGQDRQDKSGQDKRARGRIIPFGRAGRSSGQAEKSKANNSTWGVGLMAATPPGSGLFRFRTDSEGGALRQLRGTNGGMPLQLVHRRRKWTGICRAYKTPGSGAFGQASFGRQRYGRTYARHVLSAGIPPGCSRTQPGDSR